MVKEAFYFSHDSNARSDIKILALLQKHKWEGYGLYWAIVEMLRESSSHKLPTNFNLLAYELRTSNELIKSIVTGFGLFTIDENDNLFWSDRLIKSMQMKTVKSEKARESALYGWELRRNNANAMRTHSDANAIKEKKRKEKKVFTPPALDDVKKYFSENGYKTEVAERAFNGYSEANWHDSKGKPVLNWKQKMNNVWFTDENRVAKKKMVL